MDGWMVGWVFQSSREMNAVTFPHSALVAVPPEQFNPRSLPSFRL